MSHDVRVRKGRCRVQLVWKVDADLRPHGGHGIDFFADGSRADGTLVAVILGFEWLHAQRGDVEVLIRPANDRYGADFLAEARLDIERMLSADGPLPDQRWISQRLFVHVNA